MTSAGKRRRRKARTVHLVFSLFALGAGAVGCLKYQDGKASMSVASELAQARADIDAGRFGDALRLLNRIKPTSTDAAEAAYQQGRALNGLERYGDATVAFSRALELRPDWVESLIARARSCVNINQPGRATTWEAADDLKRVIELEPDNPRGYEEMAKLFTNGGPWEPAAEYWAEAIKRTPNPTAEMHLQRGYCLYRYGHLDNEWQHDVLAELDKAIALDPRNLRAWKIRYEQLDEMKAPLKDQVETMRALIDLGHDDPKFLVDYVDKLLDAGADNRLVVAEATKLINRGLGDKDPILFFIRAIAHKELGEFEAALADYLADYERSEKDHDDDHHFVLRADCLIRLNRIDQAIADCTTAIHLSTKNPWTHFARAKCYAENANYGAALNDLEIACRRHSTPGDVRDFHKLRLKCCEGLGMMEEARKAREKLASMANEDDT